MRNLGLDILRIVAVFLVLGRHFHLPENPAPALEMWQRGGWVGVDLFFVLSGFLVSSLLFEEYMRTGAVDAKRFLIRRGFKIYPAFWALLIFSLLMRYFVTKSPPSIEQVAGELLFLQNYLGGVWNHTWSLAVEEHFYLGIAALFAAVTALRPGHGFKFVPHAFAVVALTCFALRLLNLFLFPDFTDRIYLFGTHIRIDSLFFGVLLSYLYRFHDLGRRIAWVPAPALVILGVALLSPAFVYPLGTHRWISVTGVILFYVGSGFLLAAAIRLARSSAPSLKVLGALGAASYSIYLWHLPVGSWGYSFVKAVTNVDNLVLYALTYLVGSCLFGWLMNRVLERPVLLLRDSLFPSAPPSRTVVPGMISEPQVEMPSRVHAPVSSL